MDAIVMLKDDHKQVERLFKKLEKDDLSVVPEICRALTVHARMEEACFYPDIAREADMAEDIAESVEEHHLVKVLIQELEGMNSQDEAYHAKAVVLMELVRHHVDEEEHEMFPRVREALGRNRLQELGEEMVAIRDSSASAA